MSAYAYEHMNHPVVVEEIEAHAGIDIGQTLIGMHLKRVAVPIRTSIEKIGDAVSNDCDNSSETNRWSTRHLFENRA